jgi:hypothetical protein
MVAFQIVRKLIILNCPRPAIFLEHMKDHRSWYMFMVMTPYFMDQAIVYSNSDFMFKSTYDETAKQGYIGKPMVDRYRQLWKDNPTGMLTC